MIWSPQDQTVASFYHLFNNCWLKNSLHWLLCAVRRNPIFVQSHTANSLSEISFSNLAIIWKNSPRSFDLCRFTNTCRKFGQDQFSILSDSWSHGSLTCEGRHYAASPEIWQASAASSRERPVQWKRSAEHMVYSRRKQNPNEWLDGFLRSNHSDE